MITMTYDEYDSMIDAFQKIKDRDKVIPVWPSVAQIDMFKKDPEKWIKYCCFLYEFNPAPSTAEEKYSKKNLSGFINKNLELTE